MTHLPAASARLTHTFPANSNENVATVRGTPFALLLYDLPPA